MIIIKIELQEKDERVQVKLEAKSDLHTLNEKITAGLLSKKLKEFLKEHGYIE